MYDSIKYYTVNIKEDFHAGFAGFFRVQNK